MRSPLELSTYEGRHLLDAIAAMGTKLVVLTGGDPAKRSDLVPLVAHGVGLGLTMALTPSGTSLTTRSLLEQLASAGLSRLAVSIDGPDATTHDEFRRVAGSFGDIRERASPWPGLHFAGGGYGSGVGIASCAAQASEAATAIAWRAWG